MNTPFPDPLQGWPVSPQGQRARGRGGSCLTVQNHPKRCFPGTSPASLYDWEPRGKPICLSSRTRETSRCVLPSTEGLPGDPSVLSVCGLKGAGTPGDLRAAVLVAGGDRLNRDSVGANSHLSCHSSKAPFIRLVQGWEPVSSQAGEYTEASANLWGSHGE